MSLLDKASLIVTPNAVKAGKLYSIVPSSGAGDMDVSRATTATRVNSLGLIENVALNVARLDYSNGSCPSLLVEPQRTNLILNSATVATQTITTTAVVTTVSFYGTGTITFSGTYIGSLAGTGVNNRVTLKFTPTAGSLILTVVGSCVNGQLEAGSYATSYIPTVASIQTRNTDLISKTGISSLIGQTEGTLFCEINLTFLDSSLNRSIINLFVNDGDPNNLIRFRINGANFSYDIRNSGVVVSNILSPVSTIGRYKLAIIYKNNYAAFFINGVKIGENLSVSIPIGLNIIRLGTFNSSTENLIDYINSVQLYKTALTDQECINLTTL